MLIYKIFRHEEWSELEANGSTKGAPIDLSDGYVHFSTASQVRETAAKWFKDADGLFLVACSAPPELKPEWSGSISERTRTVTTRQKTL